MLFSYKLRRLVPAAVDPKVVGRYHKDATLPD